MSFWTFLTRRRAGHRPEPSQPTESPDARPAAAGATALAEDAAAETGPTSGAETPPTTDPQRAESGAVAAAVAAEITAPVDARAQRTATSRPAPAGWLDQDEIRALQGANDEQELIRLIGRKVPGASQAEVYFRYHLARAIYLGEHEIPPLPQSAAKVMDLSRNPRAGTKEYARVVEGDPGLVRAVLALANSSFYISLHKCTSLAQAMVRVGIREVERIALVQAFQAKVFRVYGHDETVQRVGSHALSTALAAQAIAQRVDVSPADAFLGGLFHDVGKLVVLGSIAHVQRKLKRTAPDSLVQSAFEAFHVLVGENACSRWQMPAEIVHAVAVHHDPQSAAELPLDRVVYLANIVAHAMPAKKTAVEIINADDPVLVASGLRQVELSEICEQACKDAKEYQRIS